MALFNHLILFGHVLLTTSPSVTLPKILLQRKNREKFATSFGLEWSQCQYLNPPNLLILRWRTESESFLATKTQAPKSTWKTPFQIEKSDFSQLRAEAKKSLSTWKSRRHDLWEQNPWNRNSRTICHWIALPWSFKIYGILHRCIFWGKGQE